MWTQSKQNKFLTFNLFGYVFVRYIEYHCCMDSALRIV